MGRRVGRRVGRDEQRLLVLAVGQASPGAARSPARPSTRPSRASNTALTGTYQVYNKYASAFVATNVLTVEPDGAGGFLGVAQSCT